MRKMLSGGSAAARSRTSCGAFARSAYGMRAIVSSGSAGRQAERVQCLSLRPAIVGLAARAALHVLDEDDLLRQLETGDALRSERAQLVGREARRRTQLHD